MSIISQLLSSLLVMLWFVAHFMGDNILKIVPSPYGEDLIRYRWLILGLGIFLSISNFTNRIRQQRKANKRDNRSRNGSRWQKNDSAIIRKDFESEQRKESFVSSFRENTSSRQTPELIELAKKVKWTPIVGGGANFKTSYLQQPTPSRIEVKKSNGGKLFSAIFIGMGCFVPGVIAYQMFMDEGFGWGILGMMAFGSIFVAVGVATLFYPRPRIFDKQIGWFWAGSKRLMSEKELSQLKKSARLSDIAAIQILSERVSGKNSNYTSWEINLVSHDAQRLNVMDHGNKNNIEEDAIMLSEFLDVPVWENT
ncbi:hypothetical protein OO007_08715 [Cocleimonas sp. KMM 6892]|uniref:hypothetical protein n=1 Tax=unclassified Cocleimonas TaxID=2639732 RepID=UPI002DB8BCE5|nr:MULTISPECIES: hypothetical protein [unclassified Cocleimonas]MEB8432309.1 hypothetical protein [Cocleimonas sp. KMM 6892]MEC4714605.1 hypothetical protein [Cocleimonas sp. KMM 6895]MEC4744581.1 hypothetical protein [Cocleimonas sp. KMM 6896]